ncbi:MAG TPA: hypothetical protein VN180_07470, partial [Acidimicrobiia bacterium]|nr:hypothetical protein [Acidimicrobiia bacterium]
DEAIAELRGARLAALPKHTGSTVAVSAALALALVAASQTEEARALAEESEEEGTFLDRIQHRMAGAFAALQAGEPGAPAAFDDVVAAADATESRLDQAITRLARAHAWRALGRPDADTVWAEAQDRLTAIGITAAGWSRVFSAAAGA